MATNTSTIFLLFLFLTFSNSPIALSLLNFNRNPNCLIMTTLTDDTQVSKNSSILHLPSSYELHLSLAHRNGNVVKHIQPQNSTKYQQWKVCCFEIVIFVDEGESNSFYEDVVTWGHHTKMVIYMVFSPHRYYTWNKKYRLFLFHFSVPIYFIVVDDRQKSIFAHLLDPIHHSASWKIFPDTSSQPFEKFPGFDTLIRSRRSVDSSQNLFGLPVSADWLDRLTKLNCENHRYFLSNGTKCFVVFGALQALQTRLNFSFSSFGYALFLCKLISLI